MTGSAGAAGFPTPDVELTHLLVVADAEVSRRWYESVLGASVERAYGGTSVVMKLLDDSWVRKFDGGFGAWR